MFIVRLVCTYKNKRKKRCSLNSCTHYQRLRSAPSKVICPFITYTCADPGIFVRGGFTPDGQKTQCFWFFLSPQLILQLTEGIQRFYYRPRIQRGSNILQGGLTFYRGGGSNIFQGVQLFPGGGVQMLISIETHITCAFPGGGGGPDPLSPLWIRTCPS